MTQNASEETIAIALVLASQVMNHQPLILQGSDEFKKEALKTAVQKDLPIAFDDLSFQREFIHYKCGDYPDRKKFALHTAQKILEQEEKSNKGGAYKRFIDLHLSEPLFNVIEGRELHLFVARCHGHFGRFWTEYIVTHAKEIRADFDAISNSLAVQHGDEYETAHLLNLVACAVAFWHFRLSLRLDTKFEGDIARADANIVLKQLPTQEEMDDSKRWLELLEGYVASHPKHFWRKVILPDGTIPTETFYAPMLYGRIFDDDSVAIIASVFKSICEELKIPAEKFINELFEQDYLVDATRKNKAKLIRIGGDRTRAFVFKSGLLWNSERRDDAIDTGEGGKIFL